MLIVSCERCVEFHTKRKVHWLRNTRAVPCHMAVQLFSILGNTNLWEYPVTLFVLGEVHICLAGHLRQCSPHPVLLFFEFRWRQWCIRQKSSGERLESRFLGFIKRKLNKTVGHASCHNIIGGFMKFIKKGQQYWNHSEETNRTNYMIQKDFCWVNYLDCFRPYKHRFRCLIQNKEFLRLDEVSLTVIFIIVENEWFQFQKFCCNGQ